MKIHISHSTQAQSINSSNSFMCPALITHKQQNDFLGRTMRELCNKGLINTVFDGHHNVERGSYTAEKGYFRYVRFEKEPYVIFIEVRGRSNYNICIHTFNGVQISYNPTSLKS